MNQDKNYTKKQFFIIVLFIVFFSFSIIGIKFKVVSSILMSNRGDFAQPDLIQSDLDQPDLIQYDESRSLLVQNIGFSNKENDFVLSTIKKQNTLRWLYQDIKVIFESNTKYCPNLEKIKSLVNDVEEVEIVCSRLVYEISEHQQFSILIKHKKSENKSLLVYNHGHGGIPASEEIFAIDFINKVLNAGYDVLIVSMPFVGINFFHYDFKVKTCDGYGIISKELLGERLHDLFTLVDTGKSHAIRFFIDDVVISVLHLRQNYEIVDYVGLSGGANTGLITCGLLAGILNQCILVAGVMPMNLRGNTMNFGDWEQFSDSLNKKTTVFDIIQEVSTSNTKLHLRYNNRDSCCFAEPTATLFLEQIEERKIEVASFKIRDSDKHGYDPEEILSILLTRQPVVE